MKIEAIRRRQPEQGLTWKDHMINVKPGIHDLRIARILGTASAWAYADLDTFFRAMARTYTDTNEAVALSVTNSALLVDNVAYLVQSSDKRLAILCFRGTDYKNITHWLGDMSTHVDPFFSAGHVHSGFYRATLALWSVLSKVLEGAASGSICDAAMTERAKLIDCAADGAGAASSRGGNSSPDTLEALYICGHSLGGAMAVIAAALLYADPELALLQDKLRGVYTFGQPMVGHKDFTTMADRNFGDKLFRHVYKHDLIPRLPPLSTGHDFAHFGAEYVSDDSATTGWVPQTKTVPAVKWVSSSMLIAALAWVRDQLPEVGLLEKLSLPWSIRDHGPIYYLRSSQTTDPSSVFV